ncbi:MAG: hypothetical protein ABEH88_11005 [Halobacteriales archaeon]
MSDSDNRVDRPRPRGRAGENVSVDIPEEKEVEPGEWYWDRRTGKGYYATERRGDTVQFVTVWHKEEAADALSTGAVVPLEEMGFSDPDRTFDLKDSFRTPPASELDAGDD